MAAINHNYDHEQQAVKNRDTQNGSKSTNVITSIEYQKYDGPVLLVGVCVDSIWALKLLPVVCCYAITIKNGHGLKLDKIGLMFSGFDLKQITKRKSQI